MAAKTQNSGASSLKVKLKVSILRSQLRMLLTIMLCAGKSQKQRDCQGHNGTATSSMLWLKLFFQRGRKIFLSSRTFEASFPIARNPSQRLVLPLECVCYLGPVSFTGRGEICAHSSHQGTERNLQFCNGCRGNSDELLHIEKPHTSAELNDTFPSPLQQPWVPCLSSSSCS